MAKLNQITRLFPKNGETLNEESIQEHLDEMNTSGHYLIAIDNLGGYYRFFWEKLVE